MQINTQSSTNYVLARIKSLDDMSVSKAMAATLLKRTRDYLHSCLAHHEEPRAKPWTSPHLALANHEEAKGATKAWARSAKATTWSIHPRPLCLRGIRVLTPL